jgi:hypothetical protein
MGSQFSCVVVAVASSLGFYPTGHWVQSSQALTIIAPYASASSANRYNKQYPGSGFVYNVPIVASGGAFPYVYAIGGAPSGMTTGATYGSANYGRIVWSNPVAGTYSLTVTVTDQARATASVSWTLTVSTSGWIFVDAVNGHPSSNNGGTGTGTLANPFQTMADWYNGTSGTGAGTRFDSTYINSGVIYMSGTYLMDACWVDASPLGQVEMNNKPKVHLCFAGASVNWDPHNAGSNAASFSFGSVSNVYIGGINFADVAGLGLSGMNNSIRVSSGATDCGMVDCSWATPSNAAVTGSNPAFVMCDDNHPSLGQRIFTSGCSCNGTNGYDVFLGYYVQNVVHEWFTCNGVNTDIMFYPKLGTNSTWTIRSVTALNSSNTGVLCRMDNYNGTANVDIGWCNYRSSGAGLYYGPNGGGTGISSINSFRNTYQVSEHTIDGGTATISVSGLTVTADVVVFTNASANIHGYHLVGVGASLSSAAFSGEECVGLNIAAVTASTGNLTGTYRASYESLRGCELA